jgi:hypothetical protein
MFEDMLDNKKEEITKEVELGDKVELLNSLYRLLYTKDISIDSPDFPIHITNCYIDCNGEGVNLPTTFNYGTTPDGNAYFHIRKYALIPIEKLIKLLEDK